MKNIQRFICAITLGLLMQTQGEVIFLDTFDRSVSLFTDINDNLVARQAGGTTGSTYTATLVGAGGGASLGTSASLNSDVVLVRTTGPATSVEYTSLDLDTDFGSSLVGERWKFSYRTRLQRGIAYDGYTGFTVGNPADTTSGAGNGVSFQIGPGGAWSVYSAGTQVGSGLAGEVTFYNNYSVTATFDEAAGAVALTVFFEGTTNTVDLGTFPASFADGSRFFELRNHLDTTVNTGVVDALFGNLKIETIEAESGVVFLDTFARSSNEYTDINTNLLIRQLGGSTGSTYTPTIVGDGGGISLGSNGSLDSDGLLLRTTGPATGVEYSSADLDTDFGPNLAGRRWEFSYRTRLQRAIVYGGYTGFTVGNPADTTSGAGNGVSFQIGPGGAWKIYSDGSEVGSGLAGENTFYNNYTVTAIFDEELGTAAFAVFFEGTTNTVDLGTFSASFVDNSRFFELRNHLDSTTNTGVVDAVFVDLKIATDPSGYAAWSNRYELVEGPDGDDDSDGLSNLHEFGLGGNPTNLADQGISPGFSIVNDSGSNVFSYVYPQLADPDSGLTYYLKLNTDLILGDWTNAGYVVTGTNVTGGAMDFVTNVTDTVDGRKFISLIIE